MTWSSRPRAPSVLPPPTTWTATAIADGSAVTTGSGTGIGAAVALIFADAGSGAVIGEDAQVTATGVALTAGMTDVSV